MQVDGVLCLADILTDDSHPEATRAEAAAVVAQVTSPHLSFTQHLSSFLESMEEIVTALISESPWVGGNLRGKAWAPWSFGRMRKAILLLTNPQICHLEDHTSLNHTIKGPDSGLKNSIVKSLLLIYSEPFKKQVE